MTESPPLYTCSFCEKTNEKVISGPVVYICFDCAAAYTELLKDSVEEKSQRAIGRPRCSFCGQTEPTVRRVIDGADASICNICLKLCNDIMGKPQGVI
jgi:ATP-dependent protease Clp ATPase subunit